MDVCISLILKGLIFVKLRWSKEDNVVVIVDLEGIVQNCYIVLFCNGIEIGIFFFIKIIFEIFIQLFLNFKCIVEEVIFSVKIDIFCVIQRNFIFEIKLFLSQNVFLKGNICF